MTTAGRETYGIVGLAGLGRHRCHRVCLPAPHPATRELLAAGWHIDFMDVFMATVPGLLDPRRAVPSPGLT